MVSEKLKRFRYIFSGKDSKDLWKEIGKIKCKRCWDAIYTMGCYCQRLERNVRLLEERVAELELTNRE